MKPHQFTLAEMLVVLAIISLVLVIVLPRTATMPAGVAIRSARLQTEKPFRDAALRARTSGQDVRLTVDLRSKTVRLLSGTEDEPAIYDLPEDVLFADGASPVSHIFLANGEASGPDLQYTCRERIFILSVDRLNGNVFTVELTK
jgi:prepilin-type N-terminal cleavage/methylation domain-containing protein